MNTKDTPAQSDSAQPFQSLAASDVRNVFGKAVILAGSVIEAVRADQLENQTPCDDFTTRQMIQHLIGVLERIAVVGTGKSPFTVSGMAGDVSDDALVTAWNAHVAGVVGVWSDDLVLTNQLLVPWGSDTGAVALTRYVNEVSVHTWDLARATGQKPDWDADVLGVAYEAMTTLLPREGRREIYDAARASMPPEMAANFKDPFVDPIDLGVGASAIDRLVAFSGRQP